MTKEHKRIKKKIKEPIGKKLIRKSKSNQEIESLINKTKIKNKQRKTKIRIYYSLLTIVLLICLAQIGFSAILNITKTISYQTKINTMKKTKDQAESRNKKLKQEIKNFSTASSLENIARNNLKMAGEDEVLVIINTAQEAKSTDKKTGGLNKFKHFGKQNNKKQNN